MGIPTQIVISKEVVLSSEIKMVSRSGSPRKSPTRAASPRKSPARAKSPAKKSPAKKSPAKKRSPSKKRKSTSKKTAAHPAYKDMIKAAIVALKTRGGSSRQAIAKYVGANFKCGDNMNTCLRMAIRRGVASGMLVQAAGHSGTFRLAPAAAKKKTPKKKKVTAKKPAAKKTPKKKKKTTKAKKPASKTRKTTTKKKPARAKSPA